MGLIHHMPRRRQAKEMSDWQGTYNCSGMGDVQLASLLHVATGIPPDYAAMDERFQRSMVLAESRASHKLTRGAQNADRRIPHALLVKAARNTGVVRDSRFVQLGTGKIPEKIMSVYKTFIIYFR